MALTFNLSAWEAEAIAFFCELESSLVYIPSSRTELYDETLSQKNQ